MLPPCPRDLPRPPGLLGPAPAVTTKNLHFPVLAMRGACGFPSPAEDFFRPEDRLDLNEKLIRNPPATFFVLADCGNSMIDFGIWPNDILIVDRSIEPRHENTVLALWEGGFTVKRLYHRGNRIELRASQGHQSIVVSEDAELDIWGVVTWNLHQQA